MEPSIQEPDQLVAILHFCFTNRRARRHKLPKAWSDVFPTPRAALLGGTWEVV